MAARVITIEDHETKHNIALTYATVYDNGLVDIRRKVTSKLDPGPGRTPDINDRPENRLTIDQLKKLVEQL